MKGNEKCIYCGNKVNNEKNNYRIHLKNESLKDVYCCSRECYKSTINFMSDDNENRIKLYILLAICVVLNVILLSYFKESKFIYLPLMMIGLGLYAWPYIFIRYRSYSYSGIKKTISILKISGIIISLISIFFFAFA